MRFVLSWIYWTYIRPLVKVVLRKITKMCELQRICYGTVSGAKRSLLVEFSLEHSKQQIVRDMTSYLNYLSEQRKLRENLSGALKNSVLTVVACKAINPRIHVQFVKSFSRCLEHIWGYKQLVNEVGILSKTVYDSDNSEHEDKLDQLWTLLNPHEPLSNRISKQWQDIGFQGNDPKTDFRGMGILGLDNLLFFAQEHNNSARAALHHSLHPTKGYAFAILGINITAMAFSLLQNGCGKTHFFNTSHRMPTIDAFHHFYCYLFIEFDRFWIKSKPSDIMDFSKIRDSFEKKICSQLKDDNCVLNIKNTVLNI